MNDLQYQTIEWQSKRKEILKRDNYSCKNCGTFNPSEGVVTIPNEKETAIELHEYNSSSCKYILASEEHGITLNIDYGWGIWLVTPILQVHHTKYIQGEMAWEYDNADLVTLCQECHTAGHNNLKIPIYDSNLNLVERRLFEPEDNNSGRKHNFKPWVFVNKYTDEYIITAVQPQVSIFVHAKDIDRIEELGILSNELYASFMKRFFPDYKSKKI